MRFWLKSAREKAGLTMKQLAEILRISEIYYCAIENGTRQQNMDISLARNLSDILGVPIKQILDEEFKRRDCASLEN